MKPKSLLNVAVVALFAVLGLYFATQLEEANFTYNGSLIEPASPALSFTLAEADGSAFSLAEKKGKVVIMFFGYTNCPDFCPTTLAEFKQVHEALGEDADQVEFVFITIDPERDTPQLVSDYADAFDPSFIGLSGTEEELQPIWDAFYVYRDKDESTDSAAGYLMIHSTRTIVIDKAGNFRMTFPYGIGTPAIIEDIQHLLAENPEG